MVVFTCQKCNTTLKKNAVERHLSCRPLLLTCIDCLKDFRGREYEEHKTCISEAQKYGGANFVAKAQGVKQEQWTELVAKVLKKISSNSRYKNICKGIISSANIPRHRVKFNNYIMSAHPRLYDAEIVNEIFDQLEAEKESLKNRASGNSGTNSTGKIEEKHDDNACILETSVPSKAVEPKKKKKIDKNLTIVNDNSGTEKITKEESSEHNGKIIIRSPSSEIEKEKNLENSINIGSQKKKKKKKEERNGTTTDDPQNSSNNTSHACETEEGKEPMELDNSLQVEESLQKKKRKKKDKSYSSTLTFLEGEVSPAKIEEEAVDQDRSFNLKDHFQKKKKKTNDQISSPIEEESCRQREGEEEESSPLIEENVSKEETEKIKNEDNNFHPRKNHKQNYILKTKILASLSFDQKTKLDCWFNIKKENELDKQNNSIDEETNQILSEEQNSLLMNENENSICTSKLSKKEQKLLKKQKKYAAEINEIENCKPEEINDCMQDEKSKNKNIKSNVTESNFQQSSKRKHQDVDEEDDPEKRMKVSLNETMPIEETQSEPRKKFKWGNVIKEVLQASSDKDLPLKKLRKKVMNEYRRQKGDDVPYDKLLGIFNKKINKTVGVKVLKDRVKLVFTDDNI